MLWNAGDIIEHEAPFLLSGAAISEGNMKPREDSECHNYARVQGLGPGVRNKRLRKKTQ